MEEALDSMNEDMSIDLSDIHEITDFSKARKNPYAEKLRKNGYSIMINVSPEDIAKMTSALLSLKLVQNRAKK